MGARNFNFASKVPQNGGFPALKCRVLNVNFSDKERNCQQFFNSSKFKEQCPPPVYDATGGIYKAVTSHHSDECEQLRVDTACNINDQLHLQMQTAQCTMLN